MNTTLLLNELFVKLVLEGTIKIEILNWRPLRGFFQIWFDF